jgi:hypothetical protein
MSGKKGQQGTGAKEIGEQYSANFMEELDGRFRTARTLKQRLRALTNDLGGITELSYQELSLVHRCLHLERLLERRESTLAHGGTIDDQSYFSGITTLSSLFTKLGLRRRAKAVMSLDQYVTEKYSRRNSTEHNDNKTP